MNYYESFNLLLFRLTLKRKEPEFYRKVSVLLNDNNQIVALGNEKNTK